MQPKDCTLCCSTVVYEEGYTLSDVICVQVVEGVGGRSCSGLVHQVDKGSVVGGETDSTRPDFGILDGTLSLGLNFNPARANIRS